MGWAWVDTNGCSAAQHMHCSSNYTNNSAELQAVIHAIKSTPLRSRLTTHTDSMYVTHKSERLQSLTLRQQERSSDRAACRELAKLMRAKLDVGAPVQLKHVKSHPVDAMGQPLAWEGMELPQQLNHLADKGANEARGLGALQECRFPSCESDFVLEVEGVRVVGDSRKVIKEHRGRLRKQAWKGESKAGRVCREACGDPVSATLRKLVGTVHCDALCKHVYRGANAYAKTLEVEHRMNPDIHGTLGSNGELEAPQCYMCGQGREDLYHAFCECPCTSEHRSKWQEELEEELVRALPTEVWLGMCQHQRLSAGSVSRSLGWAWLQGGTREAWEREQLCTHALPCFETGNERADKVIKDSVSTHPMLTLLGLTPPGLASALHILNAPPRPESPCASKVADRGTGPKVKDCTCEKCTVSNRVKEAVGRITKLNASRSLEMWRVRSKMFEEECNKRQLHHQEQSKCSRNTREVAGLGGVQVLIGDNGELPEVNIWLTKLEERRLEHYEIERQVLQACGGVARQSKGKEALKRKADTVAQGAGRSCELGQVGGANQRFRAGGVSGVSIGLQDLEASEQATVKVAINAMSQCAHTTVDSLDACSRCKGNRKRALIGWCVKHKQKARKIVQAKLNKRVREEEASNAGSGNGSKQLKLQWSSVPVVEQQVVACMAKQLVTCPVHRFKTRVLQCAVCKRARDTAHATWEELNPTKVAKHVHKNTHSMVDKYLDKYGVGVVGVT